MGENEKGLYWKRIKSYSMRRKKLGSPLWGFGKKLRNAMTFLQVKTLRQFGDLFKRNTKVSLSQYLFITFLKWLLQKRRKRALKTTTFLQ